MSDLSIHRYDFEEVHLSTVEASGQVIAKDTWTHQLPNVYDILNGVSHKFVNPSKGQAMHGYWFPLLFVAHMSFGWRYPEIGLKWWADYQYPIRDKRLALMYEIWVKDGDFDLFRSWIERRGGDYRDPALSRRAKSRIRKIENQKRDGTVEPFREEEIYARTLIASDGGDPLHLYSHLTGTWSSSPFNGVSIEEVKRVAEDALTSTNEVDLARSQIDVRIKSDGISLFFFPLLDGIHQEYVSKFPEQSFSCNVTFEGIGFLGSYQKSPITGLWFTRSHFLHLVGSVQNDNDIINTVESDSLSGNPYSEQTAEPIRIMESAKPRKAGFVTRLRNGLADMLRRGADDLHERARKNRNH